MGFTSVQHLRQQGFEAAGRRQSLNFVKTASSAAGNNNQPFSYWNRGTEPPASGAAPAALPGGDVPTSATTGAIPFVNPPSGETTHIAGYVGEPHIGGHQYAILYDRLWHGAINTASTASQSVTGVPTRYTGTDAAGTMMFVEIQADTPATAHTWTITYENQDGTGSRTATQVVDAVAQTAMWLDMPSTNRYFNFFIPLAAGDCGVRKITAIQTSATISAGGGAANIVIARPLIYMPMWGEGSASSVPYDHDAMTPPCQLLPKVYDNACLALIASTSVGGNNQFRGVIELIQG